MISKENFEFYILYNFIYATARWSNFGLLVVNGILMLHDYLNNLGNKNLKMYVFEILIRTMS